MRSRIVLIAIALAGCVQSAYFYTQLPDRVAIHFGLGGIPDSWASSETGLLIGISLYLSLVVILGVTPFVIKIVPVRFVSLPNREYWLSQERRDATLSRLAGFLNNFGIAFILFFMLLDYLVFVANMSNPVVLNEKAVWGIAAAMLIFTAGWLIVFYRSFKKP